MPKPQTFTEPIMYPTSLPLLRTCRTHNWSAMYGMLATMPDRGQVKDFILNFLDGLY